MHNAFLPFSSGYALRIGLTDNVYTRISSVVFFGILLWQALVLARFRKTGATIIYQPLVRYMFPMFFLRKGILTKSEIQSQYPENWGYSYLSPVRVLLFFFLYFFAALFMLSLMFFELRYEG